MSIRAWLRPPRQVVVTFTVVALVSTAVVGVLSWQLFEQDRELDAPRQRGLLEAAADQAARAMTTAIDRLEATLDSEPGAPVPEDISRLSITETSTTVVSAAGLPFRPTRPSMPEADPVVFASAEAMEWRANDAPGALAVYADLAERRDRATRAGALARMAPLHQRLGDAPAALRAYDDMATFDDVAVAGLPAGLVASVGRARLLARLERAAELSQAARALSLDLGRGRWPLGQAEFDFYAAQTSEWLDQPTALDAGDTLARADAAAWAWKNRASLPETGRRLIGQPRGAAVIAWRTSGDRLDVVVGGPVFLAAFVEEAVPTGFVAALRDLDGRVVVGPAEATNDAVTRLASPAGLPWTLELRPGPLSAAPIDATRRRLILLVCVTVLIVCAGWYFTARALVRERDVARLQGDFVASVSHEFRSPLTSLAHAADLLSKDRLTNDAQRHRAYEALVSDTARLRDLVEHLLDFGRFDSGTMALRRERLDVSALVADFIDDARTRVAAEGYTIEVLPSRESLMADVDRAALGRAVWNLIDNAVKYSPECRTVWVGTRREGDRIVIAVRDQGIGIPADEHAAVFGRFVRGAESQTRQIRGTGIGLALVRQIVEAHGGEVRLRSEPGQGSLFELVLHQAGDAT